MITLGDAKPRVSEDLASAGAIERLLTKEVETEALAGLYATLARLREDLDAITAVTAERAGREHAVKFDALAPLVGKMLAFAQGALTRRDPSLAPAVVAEEAGDEHVGGEQSHAPQSFASLADVDGALAAALGYFQAREPSSPALLLIAQARATLGKNLYEVIRLLAPRHAEAARVFVGPANAFAIPVSGLADAPALDFSPGEAEPAETRNQAFSLIEQVSQHLRRVEPSSPAPYLLDRARTLASRDFLTLLGEVFSPDELESMKNGS
jgi:type VI secretion system protein ImpA